MTVSSSISKVNYAGDGSTTVFAFTYPVLDESHFTVQEVNDTTGAITNKTLTTHYTVSGTGNDTGSTNYTSGNITMLTAPASGVTLVIKRNMPFQQGTDYVENDTFGAETHEEALDELTMNDQQLKEQVDQALRLPSSITAVSPEISVGTLTADQYIKLNSSADGWEFSTLSTTAGLGNVVEDTTPQLGGDLDLNGNQITSPDGTDLINIPNGTVDIQTNSSSRIDVTDSGVRLGGANARVTTVLDEDNMSSDSATSLATQQSIKAYADTKIAALLEDTTPQLGGDLDTNSNNIQIDDAHGITDDSGNEQLIFQKTASAVNHLEITNAAAGNSPDILSAGDDTNVALNISSKGAAAINLNASTTAGAMILSTNASATPNGLYTRFTAASPDNNTAYFLYCEDSTTARCIIYSDGDLQNHDNSYGAISDRRLKQDIVDASSQSEDIKKLRIKKYRMIDDVKSYGEDATIQLGVIAQEVIEDGMGGLVKYDEKEDRYSVQYSVLYMKAVKALQEQIIRSDALEAKANDLESRLAELESKK
jgi:hypothetical protein